MAGSESVPGVQIMGTDCCISVLTIDCSWSTRIFNTNEPSGSRGGHLRHNNLGFSWTISQSAAAGEHQYNTAALSGRLHWIPTTPWLERTSIRFPTGKRKRTRLQSAQHLRHPRIAQEFKSALAQKLSQPTESTNLNENWHHMKSSMLSPVIRLFEVSCATKRTMDIFPVGGTH